MDVAVYDTKPYDKEFLSKTPQSEAIKWRFFDFRLNETTARTAEGCEAVCAFVNDALGPACLALLAKEGVKFIALRCAGYNNIDLTTAKLMNLSVTRVPAYSPHAVAEHTIGLLLSLIRKIHRSSNRIRELNFSLNGLLGFEIYKKHAGIVGTGKIGKLVAQILKGFGAEVLLYDTFPDLEWAKENDLHYVDFQEILRQCDIVSLHVPLLPETYHLFNAEVLFRMKQGSVILNTSRGKVIDTSALLVALKSGHLGGVALDTYEEEEGVFFEDLSGQILKDDELSLLISFPNVLITSHQAFFTKEALAEIARITTENLLKYEKKEPFLPGTLLLDARNPT